MKEISDQANVLAAPSIIEIVKDFMIEEGFDINKFYTSPRDIHYGPWCFAGLDGPNNKFYVLPFKTNKHIYLNPADKNFFDDLRKALVFPDHGTEFASMWDGY